MRVRLPQVAHAAALRVAVARTDHDELSSGASFAFADDGLARAASSTSVYDSRSRGLAAGTEGSSCGFAIYSSLNRRVVPPESIHSDAVCRIRWSGSRIFVFMLRIPSIVSAASDALPLVVADVHEQIASLLGYAAARIQVREL